MVSWLMHGLATATATATATAMHDDDVITLV
jgi:hypothetical protein